MQEQSLVFNQCQIQAINDYRESPRTESKTEGAQVKLTATQKHAVQSVCQASGVGVSTFISEAIEAYLFYYDYKDKIKKHSDLIRRVLERLS
jgi:hypothetical protein